MFDAAGAATYADATDVEPPPPTEAQDAEPRTEIAFVDASVDGWETIRDAIRPDIEVILIEAHEDGATRVADALAGRSGVDAIHLFSHGFTGGLTLGSIAIDATNADTFAQSFAAIGGALATGADILIYGCSVASDGGELIRLIAGFTNADVAASVDATGAERLGGDWVLETSTGEIETQSPFTPGAVEGLTVMLAEPPDQNFDSEAERFLNPAGETIAGVTYTLVSPAGGTFGITSVPSQISITPDISDRAIMFNYTGGTAEPGVLDARFASASGDPFRMTSMEIDTGASLGTSTNLTISGYRNGVLVVSDTVDTAVSDAVGSIAYAKNAVAAGRGGTVSFNAQWGFVDEIRITGVDTIVVLDALVFGAAISPNAAPEVDLNGAAAGNDATRAFIEGGGPVAIAPDALVTDPDAGDSITSMVVTLTNAQAGDSLNLSGTFGTIGAGQIAGSGGTTITITGAHSRADIQAALRAIAFDNASADPATANRAVTVVVNDGTTASETRTATITITPVNDAPTLTATGISPTFTEDGAAVPLFTAAAISTVEAGQTISGLTLTVANLADGAAERIVVDGTELQLVDGGGALAGGGTVAISVAGGVATVTVAGLNRSVAEARTLVEGVAYRNASDAPDVSTARVATLTSISDSGGVADGGVDTTALAIASTITLVAVNDAPTLGETALTLAETNENAPSGSTSVATILTGLDFGDVDGPATGVVVTGLTGSGQWQASSDGVNWLPIGPVSASAARLLDASFLIRYAPDGANGETATLTLRGWDGSSGESGDLVDATTNGGTTAFSAQSATVSIVVTDVNDAPTLTDGGDYVFAGTDEDTPGASVTVSTILAGAGYADVDAGALPGLALIAASGPGVWQYSTDGGADWTAVGAVDGDSALLLRGSDQLRFLTNGVGGGTGSLSFRAWDQTGGGAAGDMVAIGATGGESAFSTQIAGATIAVADVNDAPTLGEASVALTGIDENTTSAATSVDDILTGLAFADVDGPSSGLAVIGSSGLGAWQYSTDGTTWLAVGPVTPGAALLLEASASIRYVPNGEQGESATLTLRGWDASSGASGTLADATTNGGTTPFSAQTATASILVTDVNDAPTITAPADLTVVEDAPFALTAISFADVDAGAGAVTATFAATRGSFAGAASGGVTVAGSGTGTVALTGSVDDINTFLAGGALAYVTAANDTAPATLTVTIDDGGNTGVGGALQAMQTVAISVTPVNDAPVIAGVDGESSGVVSGGGPQAVALFADATVTDVDNANFDGGTLRIEQTSGLANGSFGLGPGAVSGGNAAFAGGDAVSVGGVVIGAVLAGQDGQNGAILELTLNADATPERVQALLRALAYDAPSGLGDRGFTLTIDDGGPSGGADKDQSTATVSFTIAATPNRPIIAGLDGDAFVYREGDGPVRIDIGQNAVVTDADSVNFDGGELRVTITAGGVAAEDSLSFVQSVGEIEIDGANLRVGGVIVGAITGGADGADLVVSLNADATPERVTTLLRAIAYENLDNDAPTETARTIAVTIRDAAAGPSAATSLASLVTITIEGVNDAPALTGIDPAAQAIDDTQTISPFAAATVADPDGPDTPLTVTVTIEDAARGGFTTLAGFVDQGGGLYVFAGTQAEAQAALRALVFTPAQNRVAPGASETTSFAIVVDDGAETVSATAQVETTSVNDAPLLDGLALGQTTTDAATIAPFAAATIVDPDSGQPITVSVTLDDVARGVFTAASLTASGFADQGGGVYALTAADAATAQAALRALVYAPAANRLAVGDSEVSTFTVTVSDGVAATVVGTASVEATSVNDAPALGGLPAQQQTGQDAVVTPFAAVTIVDPDPGQPATVNVTIANPGLGGFTAESLTASGFAAQGGGVYAFDGADAAEAQAALRALVFRPIAGALAPGASEIALFSISVSDGIATGTGNTSLTISGPAPEAPSVEPPTPEGFTHSPPAPIPADAGAQTGASRAFGAGSPPPILFTPTPPAAVPVARPFESGAFALTPALAGGSVAGDPAFFVTVAGAAEAPGFGLLAKTPIAPVVLRGDTTISFALPTSTFVVENAGLRLLVGARLSDGRPLPAWIEFDPSTGTFKIDAPPGFVGVLEVLVIASLPNGQEAQSGFSVTIEREDEENVGPQEQEQEQEPQPPQRNGWLYPEPVSTHADAAGKPPVSEALKAAGRGAMATQTEQLMNLLIADLRNSDPEEQIRQRSETV
ncbi:MAG: DUF4347 domain-containing protein [Microvirga sp.]|nr:DUF4347 domain-containing protein [Microvirga sp.]